MSADLPATTRTPADAAPPKRIPGRAWVDLGVITLLSVIGIVGLETSFGSYNFLIASAAGLVVGLGVAIVTSLLRWNVLLSVAGGILAYFLVGSAAVLPEKALFVVLPSLESLIGLVLGAVYGWADILTLSTPVEAPYYIAVLPYFAAWIVALVEGLLILRLFARRAGGWSWSLLLIGPALLFLISILLGTDEAYLAAVRGVGFAVIALLWLAERRSSREEVRVVGGGAGAARRLGAVAALIVGAIVVGAGAGWALQPTRDDRFVLRETIVPPFDPTRFPSPLSSYRSYTKLLAETELFTVDGLEEGEQLRLAVMDSYDGILWTVAGTVADEEASGSFRLVGEQLPEAPEQVEGRPATVEITILDYADVWMPSAGHASRIRLLDEESRERADEFRYNAVTGTAAVTGGIERGYHYELETLLPATVDDAVLAEAGVAAVVLPPADNVPDIVAAKALELAGTEPTPIAQLRALELQLKNSGFLSHGLASDSIPSRSGHGADRMSELFERSQLVGDEEQYASVFALMARSLGYPARVVMGYAPEVEAGTTTVVGEDVTAWVEVPFDGYGWIPFFPTPDKSDVPQDQVPRPQNEPQPQVRQPPRMQDQDEDLLVPVQIDDSQEEPDPGFTIPAWVWMVGVSVLVVLALLLLPILIIALVKAARAARRRKGRGDESIAGAWEELVDRSRELGFAVPPALTRSLAARRLAEQGADTTTVALAERADGAVFAGGEVPAAAVTEYWSDVKRSTAESARRLSTGRRLLARYRIHTLGRRRAPRMRKG